MANYDALNFSQLVEVAISDFNNIFKALKGKSVQYKPTNQSDWTSLSDDTRGIATADYAGLIDNQLFRVKNVYNKANVTNVNGVIENFSGSESSRTASTETAKHIVYNANGTSHRINISSTGFDAGYYDTNSTLIIPLGGTAVVTATIDDHLTDGGRYAITTDGSGHTTAISYTPLNDTIIEEIQLGIAVLDIQPTGFTEEGQGVQATFSTSIPANGNTTLASLELAQGEDPLDYAAIPITVGASVSGDITAGWHSDLQHAGYLNELTTGQSDGAATLQLRKTYSNDATRIYIPYSEIGTIEGTGAIDISVPNDITTLNAAGSDAYTLTGSLTGGQSTITVSGTANEGYLRGDGNTHSKTITGTATVNPVSIHIKKGAIANFTYNPASDVVITGVTSGLVYNSNLASDYKLTFKLNAINQDQSFTPGYIKESTYNVSIAEATKQISIPKANISVQSATPVVDLSTTSGVLHAGEPDSGNTGAYVITTRVTSPINLTNNTPGYVKETSEIGRNGLNNTEASNKYYINRAHVYIEPTLSYSVTNVSGDGAALEVDSQTGEQIQLFTSTQPTTGDYYTITSGYNVDNSSDTGYLPSLTTADISALDGHSTVVRYLPKAVFNFVEVSASDRYIQVTQGGYIPSGTIRDIATLSGRPDYAQVQATLGITGNILRTSGDDSTDYKLSIAKGTINAGYISNSTYVDDNQETQSEGTLTLQNDYYIKKGSASISGSVSVGDLSAPTWDSQANLYKITGSASAEINTLNENNFTEGYFKVADVTINTISSANITKTLARASLISSIVNAQGKDITSDVPLTATSSNVILNSSAQNAYQIAVSIAAGAFAKAADSTEGYIKPTDPDNQNEISGSTTIKLNRSSLTATNSTNGTIQFTNGNDVFTNSSYYDSTNRVYTLQAGYSNSNGYVTASEGYLSSSDASTSATYVTASGSGTYSIPQVSFAESISTTNSLTTAALNAGGMGSSYLLNETQKNDAITAGDTVVTLKAEVTDISRSATVTPGYFKSSDYTNSTLTPTYGVVERYIKVFRDKRDTTAYTYTEGSTEYTVIKPLVATSTSLVRTTIAARGTYNKNDLVATIDANSYGTNIATQIESLRGRLAGTSAQSLS